ncbi:MAG: citrate:proton symporter [Erysipelotrichaceae bacterium]|nr:citrate:proton symporter [Erysipelotrichaceae bacterium]
MLVIISLLLIFSMIYLLLKNKLAPVAAFAILPIIAALLLGTPIETLMEWLKAGVGTTTTNAVLFIFSIIYFGVMSDAGLFDKLVNQLVKIAGKSPVLIYVATVLIALVAQLDGATATTYLITIPAMLPIFKRLKLNILAMLAVIGVTTGVFNMVPWGGTVVRTATSLTNLGFEITAQDIWLKIIPLQIVGLGLAIGLAVFFGLRDKKRITKEFGANFFNEIVTEKTENNLDVDSLKRPRLLIVNMLLTALIIFVLIKTKFPQHLVFMVGTALALVINYPGLKEQSARISAHAATAIGTAATFLAAGIFLGVFKEAGMTKALADLVISGLPNFLLPQVHRMIGLFGSAVGIVISPDLYYYSLLPVIGEVSNSLGVHLPNVGIAMLIGENVGVIISPVIPTTFLAIGLAGVELKDHIKFSLKYFLLVTAVLLSVAILMGIA